MKRPSVIRDLWLRDFSDPLHKYLGLAIVHLAGLLGDIPRSFDEIVDELSDVTGLRVETVSRKLGEMEQLGHLTLPARAVRGNTVH